MSSRLESDFIAIVRPGEFESQRRAELPLRSPPGGAIEVMQYDAPPIAVFAARWGRVEACPQRGLIGLHQLADGSRIQLITEAGHRLVLFWHGPERARQARKEQKQQYRERQRQQQTARRGAQQRSAFGGPLSGTQRVQRRR